MQSVVARYEVSGTAILNGKGKLVGALPGFAQEAGALVVLYRAMIGTGLRRESKTLSRGDSVMARRSAASLIGSFALDVAKRAPKYRRCGTYPPADWRNGLWNP